MAVDKVLTRLLFSTIFTMVCGDCNVAPSKFDNRDFSVIGQGCVISQNLTWLECAVRCYTIPSCVVVTFSCPASSCECEYCTGLTSVSSQDPDIRFVSLNEKMIAQNVPYPPLQYIPIENGFQVNEVIRMKVKLTDRAKITLASDPPNGDIPLRIEIKIVFKGFTFSRYVNGGWHDFQFGISNFAFQEGQDVEILLLGFSSKILVYIDLRFIGEHLHTTTLSNINAIGVEGILQELYIKA